MYVYIYIYIYISVIIPCSHDFKTLLTYASISCNQLCITAAGRDPGTLWDPPGGPVHVPSPRTRLARVLLAGGRRNAHWPSKEIPQKGNAQKVTLKWLNWEPFVVGPLLPGSSEKGSCHSRTSPNGNINCLAPAQYTTSEDRFIFANPFVRSTQLFCFPEFHAWQIHTVIIHVIKNPWSRHLGTSLYSGGNPPPQKTRVCFGWTSWLISESFFAGGGTPTSTPFISYVPWMHPIHTHTPHRHPRTKT